MGGNEQFKALLRAQLPRTIADRFLIEVQTDAYMLSPIALFHKDGRVWTCLLEPATGADGMRTQLPEEFIAKLTLVV